MSAVDVEQLIFAVDVCRDHRAHCQACLVAELMQQAYCPLYDHLAMHAFALLEDELWPPEEIYRG